MDTKRPLTQLTQQLASLLAFVFFPALSFSFLSLS
jgi:hypothetical protein